MQREDIKGIAISNFICFMHARAIAKCIFRIMHISHFVEHRGIIDFFRPGFFFVQSVRRSYEAIGGIRKAYGNLYDSSAECLAPGDV